VDDLARKKHHSRKRKHRNDGHIDDELRNTQGQAGLQDQPVERHQGQPEIAGGGQAALTAKLDQHAFAIGLAVQQLQATVDVLAIGARGEEQQIDSFDEQPGRQRDEQIDHVDRVDIERHGYSGFPGSK
jgi:hypothetical protein